MSPYVSLIASLILTCALSASAAPPEPSPYAGMETRAVKALSAEEIDDLHAGKGMGLAMVAELNGYPGPKHLLELAEPLDLTAEQTEAIRAVEVEMHERAVALGRRVVEAERDLDRAFAEGRITEADLEDRLDAIGRLRGELRFAHVRAHLTAREIVTPAQRALYDRLRGYADDGAGEHRGHGAHGHAAGHDGHGDHGGHGH